MCHSGANKLKASAGLELGIGLLEVCVEKIEVECPDGQAMTISSARDLVPRFFLHFDDYWET